MGIAKNARLLEQVDIERAVAAEVPRRWAKSAFLSNPSVMPPAPLNAAPGDCQDRAHRPGGQPTFHRQDLKGPSQSIYDGTYCARGEMENRIKEQQLGLFADRTSSHYWWANQFRLLLASLAYVLMEGIRRLALKGTCWPGPR